MSFSQRALMVQYAVHGGTLSDRDKDDFEAGLGALARAVETFPSSVLHVDIEHQPRTHTAQVKVSLELARSMQFVAREDGEHAHPAFKKCVRRLVEQVAAFKESRRHSEKARTTEEVPATLVRAPVEPDVTRLTPAVEAGDYVAFRDTMGIYRESLRKRIGRRIELHPEAAARLDVDFTLDDCVELVLLDAFEQFDSGTRTSMAMGEWLETLIDGAVRDLGSGDEEALRNVSFVRSARRTEPDGPRP